MEKTIKTTMNYSIFNRLNGNRNIDRSNVEKIKKSIKEFGYFTNPIIVNENLEIVDGQHRAKALEELNIPIDYVVVEDLGIEACRNMNQNQKNWSQLDWIKSYAENGNENYIKLLEKVEKYQETCLTTICAVCAGTQGMWKKELKNENYKYKKENEMMIFKTLEFLRSIKKYRNVIKGSKQNFDLAIIFCLSIENIDENKLYDKIKDNCKEFSPIATVYQAIENIENFYNYKTRSNQRIYFTTEYKKYIANKNK